MSSVSESMRPARLTVLNWPSIHLVNVLPLRSECTPCLASGKLLFRSAQPRKLCVQNADSFGGGFPRYRAWRHGFGRWWHQGAAGSLVAAVGLAAAGAQAA